MMLPENKFVIGIGIGLFTKEVKVIKHSISLFSGSMVPFQLMDSFCYPKITADHRQFGKYVKLKISQCNSVQQVF